MKRNKTLFYSCNNNNLYNNLNNNHNKINLNNRANKMRKLIQPIVLQRQDRKV